MLRGVELERHIRTIVARLARHPDPGALRADADLYRELGIASSGALELLLSLEDELGVHLSDADFNEARSIDSLCALVSRGGHS